MYLDTIKKVKLVLGDKCVDHINGAVSPQRRQEIIDEFNNAKAGAVLPAQIQAGGTGLYIIGDGSGVTHSLSHASASGVFVAREILEQ